MELDEKDWKILAYKETVSQLQEEVVNLRVQVTVLSQMLQQKQQESDGKEKEDSAE